MCQVRHRHQHPLKLVYLGTAADYTILTRERYSTVPEASITGTSVSPYRCDFHYWLWRCWTWGQFFQQPRTTGKAFAASYGGPVAALTVAVLISRTATLPPNRRRQDQLGRRRRRQTLDGRRVHLNVSATRLLLQLWRRLTLCSSRRREPYGQRTSSGRSLNVERCGCRPDLVGVLWSLRYVYYWLLKWSNFLAQTACSPDGDDICPHDR
jgi:hypothetical protein